MQANRLGLLNKVFTALSLGLLLNGCMHDQVRRDASEQMRLGRFEEAIETFDTGLKTYPNEAALRAARLSARSEVSTKLLASAAELRADGQVAAAQVQLERLRKLDPRNDRAAAALLDIEREQRVKAFLNKARQFVEAKQWDDALQTAELGLKEDPRNPELLSLQRRIELDLKGKSTTYGATQLADTRPVSLDFRDVNLRMLLEALSRSTGIDFVLDKDVRQDIRVTVFLREARLEDALDLITGANQLNKKVLDSRTVLIYPNSPEKLREYQDLLVKAFFLANTEAKQTAALLRSILKIKDPFVDDKLNMIVLREPAETIRLAERLVALHDIGEPEVMMEVEVLEIDANRLLNLGVQLPTSLDLLALAPASGASGLTLGNIRGIDRNRIGLGIGGVTISAKADRGSSNILANPRIRAKNREKAKVLVGDKIPVVTSTTSASGFVAESVTYLDVGLKVELEPQISLDDEVSIKVNMEVSSLGTQIKTATGSVAYQIGTRSASTSLRLRDGETQVLAGLISSEDRKAFSGIPGLVDLPILGRLFGGHQDDTKRTEIVLAITPRIIRNIRRPDINMTEFMSGSEANSRLRVTGIATGTKTDQQSAETPAGLAVNSVSNSPPTSSVKVVQPPIFKIDLLKPVGTLTAGQKFEVPVMVIGNSPVRGLPLQIKIDPTVLELLDVVEGDYFKQGSVGVSVAKNIDSVKGESSIGVIRNTGDGAQGDGIALKLVLRAKRVGESEIRVVSANAVHLGQPVSAVIGPSLTLQIK